MLVIPFSQLQCFCPGGRHRIFHESKPVPAWVPGFDEYSRSSGCGSDPLCIDPGDCVRLRELLREPLAQLLDVHLEHFREFVVVEA